jgi:hypothetical protein
MVKVALLIGVSQYGAGFNQLPAAAKDVAAMQRVWQHPDMGDFDEVVTLIDPEPQEGSKLSIYTRFLVEGIETGAADLDEDEVISADELHEYASIRVQKAAPAMKPEIYTVMKISPPLKCEFFHKETLLLLLKILLHLSLLVLRLTLGWENLLRILRLSKT